MQPPQLMLQYHTSVNMAIRMIMMVIIIIIITVRRRRRKKITLILIVIAIPREQTYELMAQYKSQVYLNFTVNANNNIHTYNAHIQQHSHVHSTHTHTHTRTHARTHARIYTHTFPLSPLTHSQKIRIKHKQIKKTAKHQLIHLSSILYLQHAVNVAQGVRTDITVGICLCPAHYLLVVYRSVQTPRGN